MTIKPETQKTRSRTWVWTILVLLVLAAGVFLFIRYQAQVTQQRALANLITQPLQRQTLAASISGTGNLTPRQSTELTWQSAGKVGEISVELGQEVEAGQVLAALDENELPANILQARLERVSVSQSLADLQANTDRQREKYNADLAAAQAALPGLQEQIRIYEGRTCTEWNLKNLRQAYDDAQKNYQDNPDAYRLALLDRARNNLDFCDPELIAGTLSDLRAQLSAQEGNIASLESKLEKIKNGPDPDERQKLELQAELLDKTLAAQEITAPFAGTVTAVYNLQGDTAAPGLPAFQLDDLSELYVAVPISEVDIMHVKPGQKAQLVFDAYYDQSFSGEVTAIERAPRSQAGVVSYMVRIRLVNGNHAVNPGMTAGVTIIIAEKPDVLAVPAEAVVNRDGKTYVYVQRDGQVAEVEVQLGEYSDRSVELVDSPLAEGELIVLNPPVDLMQMMTGGRMNFGR